MGAGEKITDTFAYSMTNDGHKNLSLSSSFKLNLQVFIRNVLLVPKKVKMFVKIWIFQFFKNYIYTLIDGKTFYVVLIENLIFVCLN